MKISCQSKDKDIAKAMLVAKYKKDYVRARFYLYYILKGIYA